MSREAFGDPPESQEPPQLCPLCGGEWHAEGCDFGQEVSRRLKAERDAHRMQFALRRLWPALDRAMAGLVFTADRAGEVQADMNTLREYSKTPEHEPEGATRCEGCAELRDQLRDLTRQSNLDAMRVGKLAEDVERYSALHARLFVEKTAAQIEAENLRDLLHRMLEASTTQIGASWKDAIRQAMTNAQPVDQPAAPTGGQP